MDAAPRLLLWVWTMIGLSLQDQLRVSPDQSQFFRGSEMSVRCSDPTWLKLRDTRVSSRGRCGHEERFISSGAWCKVKYLEVQDSGQYWCESAEGATSEKVTITVKDRGVVLLIPVLPVIPGESVSLKCRHYTVLASKARFYSDGRLVSEEAAGVWSVQRVALSHDGLYRCEINGERSEAASLRVKAVSPAPSTMTLPPLAPPTTTTATPPPSPDWLRLLVPVLASVGGLVLVLLVVLVVLLVRRRRRKANKGSSSKRRRRKSPEKQSTDRQRQNTTRKCPKCGNANSAQQPLSPRPPL